MKGSVNKLLLCVIAVTILACSKDQAVAIVDDNLSLYAGQMNDLTYFSNLSVPFKNTQDSNIFEYDSIDIDINKDNIPDVAFVSVNLNEETYCEFKAINPDFRLFSDSSISNYFIIKKYDLGESIDQFHRLTSPNLYITLRNNDVDILDWNGTENKYMAFSYVADNGYIKGLGWIEVSISEYYNFTVHNWGVIENDVRN